MQMRTKHEDSRNKMKETRDLKYLCRTDTNSNTYVKKRWIYILFEPLHFGVSVTAVCTTLTNISNIIWPEDLWLNQ